MRRRAAGIFVCLCAILAGCHGGGRPRLVIGSKNFTEQIVLAELLSQHIQARTGIAVESKVNLGGTLVCHQALRAGQIDLYPEYTGTASTAVYGRVKAGYAERFGLEVTEPLGFNNTFAMVVRGEDARREHLRTISDIAAIAPRWRVGVGYEFLERPDGYRGWAETYHLRFAVEPHVMDLGLIYRALREHQVNIVAGNATDGLIDALDLVALEDDRHYFPPYDAVPIVRRAALDRVPGLRAALADLAGRVSEGDMRRMNYAVDGEHRDAAEVVREFRRSKGL